MTLRADRECLATQQQHELLPPGQSRVTREVRQAADVVHLDRDSLGPTGCALTRVEAQDQVAADVPVHHVPVLQRYELPPLQGQPAEVGDALRSSLLLDAD